MCRIDPTSLPAQPSTARIIRTIELSAAATLAVTSLILIAVYLTDTSIEPHPGNVMLTGAGVAFVVATVLAAHSNISGRLDHLEREARMLRVYTMVSTAEQIESHTDDPDIPNINRHRDR